MAEIIRAKNSGFCFGVKQAIEKTEAQVEKNRGKRIFTCGPLIHNQFVTGQLAEKGVGIIYQPEEAEAGDIVIVRSHGETKAFFDAAEARGLEVVDATCPFVNKIHKLVFDADSEGKNIVIVGDRNHPEVVGINGWCRNRAYIVNGREDADAVNVDKIFLVCQTTIKKELMDQVIAALSERDIEIEVNNTICNATRERQESCDQLSKEVEAMVIVGGRNSSNTRKLYEISKKNCNNSYFVENIEDLPLKELKKCNKIGIAAGASTPECVIKEVIANMSELNEKFSMEDFMDEIDASLRLPRVGEVVDGSVHQVTEKEVIVNMGCKKDGILPVEEVTLEEGQKLADLFKEGDEIQAKVIKTDDGDGGILLSKKKLEINEHWNEINEALENKSNITVKVVKQVNGGVIAAYKEVTGFIPLSQLSDKFVESADEFLGQVLEVKVTRVDQKRGRAVFSRKAVLGEARQAKIAAIWEGLNVDDVVEGTVMRFTDYGAFVDLGGIDGLLHISEISWGKLKHPQEVLQIGDKVNVKILSMNEEKGKISLGLKQTMPEPWSVIDDTYAVGQVVAGKVVQIKEYGAFVELEPGLDGLVHISEVAHKRVTNIADELSIGQEVSAKILEIDKDRKRISLSIKETVDAPAEEAVAEDAE
ncbi:MAG: bifunctional 4-hydroxy-3-methylbut-2-enyl diphosphate reductase/30S ribosomal protein S1 [Firmicutes bacterium]|nr:bifunctional 4-hydroxy-3-methylbut-2-enyl diphosphate reductase/30S ribosomal protein S1 [Bacillota bacterium]